MIHWFVVGVEYFLRMLGVGVIILVYEEFRQVGSCW